jgi:hypothetical protein
MSRCHATVEQKWGAAITQANPELADPTTSPAMSDPVARSSVAAAAPEFRF